MTKFFLAALLAAWAISPVLGSQMAETAVYLVGFSWFYAEIRRAGEKSARAARAPLTPIKD